MREDIQRAFVNVPTGQIHVRSREGAAGVPLVMLHAAPGSALMLAKLQTQIDATSYAFDLPGMGDSDALAQQDAEPTIADFTRPISAAIDALKLQQYDVYGTLSGVRVALELARTDKRVRRVVLDGIGVPKPEQLEELLDTYAPPFQADINGNHLLNTFLLCRDQYLFYPWYARDAEHRRPNGLPDAATLHIKVMEALKSAPAFRPLIRAAFRYDCAAALAALTQPALISADGASVRPDLPVLEFPPAEPLTCPEPLLMQRAARINAFLA
ncbi:MAG: alpha/beta fold hydrolase [Burkholderiales bacterium]